MSQKIFRCLLLLTLGLVVLHVSHLENKFPIMVGWTIGAVLAFIIGSLVLNHKTRKDRNNMDPGK